MEYPYFKGLEADRYSFYRVPKALVKADLFQKMSGDAKLLYAVLLDRMSLSIKNGWQDKHGNAYIICTIEEVMDSIHCARQKAVKLLDELEQEFRLIERRRQGLGKPNLLYVKDLYAGLSQSNYWKYENHTSDSLKNELPGVPKSNGSNTEKINKTDNSETDLIYPAELQEEEQYRCYFKEALELEILEQGYPADKAVLYEILELLVETVTSRKKFLRICGEEKPKEVVKSRLMKLDSSHIQYILECLKENSTQIRNIKQYLLATLYNAPVTVDSYYSAQVRHEFGWGGRVDKKQYKDAYAAAKRGQKAGTAASKQAAAATNTITEKAKAAVQEIIVQNKTLWVSIGVGILLMMVMLGAFSSCGAAIQGTGSTFVGTTYPSKDADMKGAEEDYLELEKELDKQIRQMESTHPGYDEYRYQLDEIGHDPYQLISHLTAVYEQFTRGQVKPVIKELFKQQYLLKVWETIEIRTRMETRVGIRPTIDAFGNVSMETYTYQEEVEYEYKILNVLLKNKGFDTIARKNMNRKQTGRYDAYNLTYGNRPELFGAGSPTYSGGTTGSIGTGGAGGSGGGFKYDIPSEALSDEKFARMIEEAEKYLGMPYVWGGSSPSTSFDCSGFVCWVINNSGNGWSVGRTTANGLRGKCSYVSPADAQPGDLIFFEKTYNTVGASHVGIYVGNGMMIHCGDPISYTSINSTYWQSHFLGFGRIN